MSIQYPFSLTGTFKTVGGVFSEAAASGDPGMALSYVGDVLGDWGDRLGKDFEVGVVPWALVGTLFFSAAIVANSYAGLEPIFKEELEQPKAALPGPRPERTYSKVADLSLPPRKAALPAGRRGEEEEEEAGTGKASKPTP
eukprot:3687381-Amphidinium_carterae.1